MNPKVLTIFLILTSYTGTFVLAQSFNDDTARSADNQASSSIQPSPSPLGDDYNNNQSSNSANNQESSQNNSSTQPALDAPKARAIDQSSINPKNFNSNNENTNNTNLPKIQYIQPSATSGNSLTGNDSNQMNLDKGMLSFKLGRYNKAIEQLSNIPLSDKNFIEAENIIGICHLRLGEYDSAYKAFNQCLALNPDYVDALDNLGSVYLLKENYHMALNFFQKEYSATKNPSANLLVNIATCYFYLKNLPKSQEFCNLAIAQNCPQAYNLLGWIEFTNKNYDKALALTNKALTLKPQYAQAYFHRAQIFMALNQNQDACESFQESLKYEQNPTQIKQIQTILEALKNRQNSQIDISKLSPDEISNLKKVASDLNNLAVSFYNQNNYELAQNFFMESLNKYPMISTNYNLATLFLKKKDLANAKLYYIKALDLATANKTICYQANIGLGKVYLLLKQYDLARDCFKLAIAQGNKKAGLAVYNLVLVYHYLNEPQKSQEYFKIYKSTFPQDKEGIDKLLFFVKS